LIAPVSGPDFRDPPTGFAEIFQPITECSPEPTVQLSTLRTETEKIQAQKDQQQAELLACRNELGALRAVLHQQCLELRSQVISLRSQVDTSQAVQRDFVELSQSLQVKLELIRQAKTLEQVREILGESVGEAGSQPADVS
ncbi:hypothetical protein GOODEAATRI_021894, partial [Goodea atripinnis]